MRLYYLLVLLLGALLSCQDNTSDYVCKPCDLSCDALIFNAPGTCPHCSMDLVKKSELIPEKPLTINEIKIRNGSGKFIIEGGFQKENTIVIHYYKP